MYDAQTLNYVNKAIAKHGDRYQYGSVVYVNAKEKIDIICKTHGVFKQMPYAHLNGQGCRHCSIERNNAKLLGKKRISNIDELRAVFVEKLKGKYPQFSLKHPEKYTSSAAKTEFMCNIHNSIFKVTPANVLCGRICKLCRPTVEKRPREIDWDLRKDVFLGKMKSSTYTVKDINQYTHNLDKITFICAEHGEFEMSPVNVIRGCKCGACNSMSSRDEQTVVDCLPKTTYIKRNIKQFLGPYELDIFLPDQMVGIEVNGVKWHSDEKKHPEYHLTKTLLAEEKGIQLYHFLDTEINEKLPIIQSMIQTKIGINKKIFARKTTTKEVDSITARDFMQTNHIQGGNSTIGKHAFGLYHRDLLVSVMTFGDSRFDKTIDLELIRFASLLNHVIIGGASKLLKAARQKLGTDKSIISYANRRWSQGNLYKQLGFTHTHNSTIGYGYTNGNVLISRMKAQKHKLEDLLGDVFDPTMTEEENMAMAGWNRVYDCGNMVFVLKQ